MTRRHAGTASSLAATLAVLGALFATAAGAATVEDLTEGMTIRLHDLPQGFVVGDDSGCGIVGLESGEDALERWAVKYRPEGCGFQYERIYASPLPERYPSLIESTTLQAGRRGAHAGLFLAALLAVREIGASKPPLEGLAPGVGDAARLFHSRSKPRESLLVWRSGDKLAILRAGGANPHVNDRALETLAPTQQGRIESPAPYLESERDDTEVPLDDPGLTVPVLWLGGVFNPGGGLPPSALDDAFAQPGPPLEQLELQYDQGPRLAIWTRIGWRRYKQGPLARANWSRCTRATQVALPSGVATVYSTYLPHRRVTDFGGSKLPRPKRCGAPNHHFAVARLDGVVVGVDLTVCFTCAEPHEGPYDSAPGMEAIVRALYLRRVAS